MLTLTPDQWNRLEVLSYHPRCTATFAQLIESAQLYNKEHGVSLDVYIATVAMQCEFMDTMHEYLRDVKDCKVSFGRAVTGIGGCMGYVLALLTQESPMPGNDFAEAVANDTITGFATHFANNITVLQLPLPPVSPTNSGNTTFN